MWHNAVCQSEEARARRRRIGCCFAPVLVCVCVCGLWQSLCARQVPTQCGGLAQMNRQQLDGDGDDDVDSPPTTTTSFGMGRDCCSTHKLCDKHVDIVFVILITCCTCVCVCSQTCAHPHTVLVWVNSLTIIEICSVCVVAEFVERHAAC